MKKLFLFLVLAVTLNISAQSTTYIAKPLELNTVPASVTKSDSVLVRGADKIVKYVPRSEFGGSGGSQDLQSVLNNGSSGTLISGSGVNSTALSLFANDGVQGTSLNGTSYLTGNIVRGSFIVSNGNPFMRKEYHGFTSNLSIADLTANNNYILPAKPEGSYTLATADELTLDNILWNNDTAVNKAINLTDSSNQQSYFTAGQSAVRNYDTDVELGVSANGYVYFKPVYSITRSNMLDLTKTTEGVATFKLPEKPDGNYTLVTTEDISGGGGTLQDVLNNSNGVYSSLSNDTDFHKEAGLVVGADAIDARIDFFGETSDLGGEISIINGVIQIEQQDKITAKSTRVEFEHPTENVILKFPTKAEGTYTIATTDDITGGSQDLQQVLDVGGYAEVDEGASYLGILGGTPNDRYFAVTITDGIEDSKESALLVSNEIVRMENSATDKSSRVVLDEGKIELSVDDHVNGGGVELHFPEALTAIYNINIPTKTVEGDYTLATIEDMVKGEYATNTAAIAAGLKNGDFYHLPISGDNYVLAVVRKESDFVELTFSDINTSASSFGISDINDVDQWNTYLATKANAYTFDSASVTGNTIKLSKEDTSGIIFMNFQDSQAIGFNIKGWNDATELYIDGNPITSFDPDSIPDSLVTLSFYGCSLTSFNPTSPMPATLESLILSNNDITTSSWNTDTAWISSLPSGSGRQFGADGNTNTVTGTATDTGVSAKGWTITP
ncbi:leucine-rich repeat domain-containing protein [Flavobacterium hydrophilum]|uniref:Uncharacterized protein n=1 Tax=Flavobacterium hydrophilum TaxID=2211445 RepID=A0A2V4C0L8_9FLAO|nr:hypothetical protein [Flavobacterium hydrophilum]PXY44537.1 hypothetical protein DMB68_13800 [Flavobacterium hydrophilum]